VKLNHWKNYEPITGVTAFDPDDAGPAIADLQVIANTHASDTYPDARIALVIGGLGTVGLTSKQSTKLRAYLERAECDARVGAPVPATATGTEGRCEGCSRLITAGELVHVVDDGGGERVVVHAGRCPSAG
jgi:hypothetical protein